MFDIYVGSWGYSEYIPVHVTGATELNELLRSGLLRQVCTGAHIGGVKVAPFIQQLAADVERGTQIQRFLWDFKADRVGERLELLFRFLELEEAWDPIDAFADGSSLFVQRQISGKLNVLEVSACGRIQSQDTTVPQDAEAVNWADWIRQQLFRL